MQVVKKVVDQVKDLFSKSISEEMAAIGSLGVDIGSHAVKVVRLDVAKDQLKVLGFGVERVSDKNYHDALAKALNKANASAKQSASVSVGGQGVVSRYVELPAMNRSELDSSMKFEVEKYVPFPMAEVVSDYAIVQELKDKAKVSVLIAAAKSELIQKKSTLATEVNLNLRAVDLDCLALANFFTEIAGLSKKDSCGCIINFGKAFTSIDIVVDGAPALSRDIFIGGDDITKKMVEVMDMDYAGAEKLKMDPKSKIDECQHVWEYVLNNLAGEIRVSLDYFETRSNRVVDKIYLAGGSSRLEGIEEHLSQLLAVDVKKIDYASRLKFDEYVDKEDFRKNADLLVIAFGLALR